MAEYIDRETALSFPFANGQYDHENANEHFIFGCEAYKEWLEQLTVVDASPVVRCKDCKYNPHSRDWSWVACPMTGKDTRKDMDFCSYGRRLYERRKE